MNYPKTMFAGSVVTGLLNEPPVPEFHPVIGGADIDQTVKSLDYGCEWRMNISVHEAKVIFVPAMFRMNLSGMAFSNSMMAFRPVQWQGII